ncbi:MAG: hypothetical protein PVJ39_17810 [Gammaproteobacteria bacterium]|jgi:hypothetical protein
MQLAIAVVNISDKRRLVQGAFFLADFFVDDKSASGAMTVNKMPTAIADRNIAFPC